MADLRTVIREMLAKGMSEQQIKDNLAELGVENADEMYAAATEQLKSMTVGQNGNGTNGAGKPSGGMNEMDLQPLTGTPAPQAPVAPPAPRLQPPKPAAAPPEQVAQMPLLVEPGDAQKSAPIADAMQTVAPTLYGSSDDKLDEAIALLKALNDLNKKILEANRDILLRLKS